MHDLPNLLLVAGTGRNVGKTSFACVIIQQLSGKEKVIGIKISPHFHKISKQEKIIINNEKFVIIEELNSTSGKDSSRLLQSGADTVFYVQANDEVLEEVYAEVLKLIPDQAAVVCESGGLRLVVKPGLFFVCKKDVQTEMKDSMKCVKHSVDKFVILNENSFDFDVRHIYFENNKWVLKI